MSSPDGTDTGWKTFEKNRYFTTAVMTCPSQSNKISLDSTHRESTYSYRYNSRRAMAYNDGAGIGHPNGNADLTPPPRHLLYGENRGWWSALFTDAANGRRDVLYQVVWRDNGYNYREWGHKIGGNVMTHAGGRLVWLLNQPPRAGQEPYYSGFPAAELVRVVRRRLDERHGLVPEQVVRSDWS